MLSSPGRQVVAIEVETGLLLWKFHLMGWHKSFVVGILLRLDMGSTRPGELTQKAIENGPVEIVDFPIKNGDFPIYSGFSHEKWKWVDLSIAM